MKYLVIGLGNTGMSLISMLKYARLPVQGYNRQGKTLENIKQLTEIKVDGLIDFSFKTDFIVEDLKIAINDADLIFICVPAYEHESLAKTLSKINFKSSLPPMILLPGRVFGAINFKQYLGHDVAESQTVPYAARYDHEGLVSIYAKKTNIIYSSPNIALIQNISEKLPPFLNKIFTSENDYKAVTLSNVGLVLHCAPLLFNSGLIYSDYDFMFYKDLVSKEIAFYMEQIDYERLKICNNLGVYSSSVALWLEEQYEAKDSSNLYRALHTTNAYLKIISPKTLDHRYLKEDLVYGLVPLEKLATNLGINVPYLSNLIDTACMLINQDFRKNYTGAIPDWESM